MNALRPLARCATVPVMPITYRLYQHPVRQFIKERARAALGDELRGDGLAWFAEQIDTSASQLSRVVNGRVALTHEMAVRIANGLGIPHEAVYEVEFEASTEQVAG